ncbi:pro-opiomelanocortin-like [Dunckerocampus dactyliophorus]|uniref:pro-opiomelanocortin-like n=1 Tax=Dunckerocampus dactyliophorus TaxID=161453 RepID=UPI002407469C|nr:pro-opiomelanocortin-like [Dunckerocampus dactyliophorus]
MVLPCWLSVALMACISIPVFGSECSICKNLSNNERILDCIEICRSASQTERPDLSTLALNISKDNELLPGLSRDTTKDKTPESKANSDRRRSYLIEHFRWSKPSRNMTQVSRPGIQSNRRSAYSMEHFRWGKPPGNMTPGLKLGPQGSKRSPYAMEHFRWGKPSGRKRRPVKIFAFPVKEPSLSSEAVFLPQARRHLNSKDDIFNRNQIQALQTETVLPLQRGSPSAATNINGNEEKPQGVLANIFRDIIFKDVQRIVG